MVAKARKVIDWKPQKVTLTVPPSTEPTVIEIDVQPVSGRGRAYVDAPESVSSRFEKQLTKKPKPEKI